MKKLIALAAAAMMLLSLFTACGKEPAANNDNDTEKTTTFTVGFDAEFPPYGYQDENGEYVGFDLDLAAEVCTRNGWELVKKPINWDSKDMELNTEVISCIWNGFTMQGREDKYTWSEAYVDNSQVIVVKEGQRHCHLCRSCWEDSSGAGRFFRAGGADRERGRQ